MTRLRALVDGVRAMDPVLLIARWSLLVLLVNSNEDPIVFVGLAIVAAVALPRPSIVLSPWFWAAAFVVIGLRQLATWHTVDDHIVVTTYWCAALALGLTARDARATLAASARLLLGVVFALAAAWKLGSGQFIDGTFFRFTLLFDDRFETVARWIGGSTPQDHRANVDAVNALLALDGRGPAAALVEGPRNILLAGVFTAWGVAIESAIAVSFLLPLRRRYEWLRHACLLAFAGTTYLIVPVGGFGTLLMLLGASQSSSERMRMTYLVAGLGLLVWAGVWPLIFL